MISRDRQKGNALKFTYDSVRVWAHACVSERMIERGAKGNVGRRV